MDDRGYLEGPVVLVTGPALLALETFLEGHRADWARTAAKFAVRGDLGTATLFDRVVRAAAVLKDRAAKQAELPQTEIRQLPDAETSASSSVMTTDEAAARLDLSAPSCTPTTRVRIGRRRWPLSSPR